MVKETHNFTLNSLAFHPFVEDDVVKLWHVKGLSHLNHVLRVGVLVQKVRPTGLVLTLALEQLDKGLKRVFAKHIPLRSYGGKVIHHEHEIDELSVLYSHVGHGVVHLVKEIPGGSSDVWAKVEAI